jgi:uncharacterized protein YbdZ (MbtH family)
MTKDGESFDQWIDQAKIPPRWRSARHRAVLQAAFAFLQQAGNDYASQRILAHFLLNCQLDLKLAQVARLVGVTRPTASRQNQLSSRQVVREIQQRLSGRPYGKLLARYAGPIAHFLITQPDASRDDLLDFIEATWNVRVSLTALHNFLKKYGLDRPSLNQTPPAPAHVAEDEQALIQVLEQPPASGLPLPEPAENFFSDTPNMLAPSC